MDKRLVIWLIGSSASGKTTQAKMLHNIGFLDQKKVHISNTYKFTTFGNIIGNVGVVSDKDCSGTDTCSTKELIQESYNQCIKNCSIVVLDGIMATATWIDFFKTKELLKKYNITIYTILLDVDIENNIQRLIKRRAKKKNISADEVIIEQKTYDSLNSKIKAFQSIFRRTKDLSDFTDNFDTTKLTIQQINQLILNKINNILDHV